MCGGTEVWQEKPDNQAKLPRLNSLQITGEFRTFCYSSLGRREHRCPGLPAFAKVSIPPGKRPFLEKVELQGDFGINAGTFTNSNTQEGVNHLSEGVLANKINVRTKRTTRIPRPCSPT